MAQLASPYTGPQLSMGPYQNGQQRPQANLAGLASGTNLGPTAGPYSDADIRNYLTANANNPGAIYNAMRQSGVGWGDIARAGNWTAGQIGDYVRNSGHQGLQDWYGQTVRDYTTSLAGDPAALYGGMQQYGLSPAEVARATGWSGAQVGNYVAQSGHQGLQDWLRSEVRDFGAANASNPGAIHGAMRQYGMGFGDLGRAGGWSDAQMGGYVDQSGSRELQDSWDSYLGGQGGFAGLQGSYNRNWRNSPGASDTPMQQPLQPGLSGLAPGTNLGPVYGPDQTPTSYAAAASPSTQSAGASLSPEQQAALYPGRTVTSGSANVAGTSQPQLAAGPQPAQGGGSPRANPASSSGAATTPSSYYNPQGQYGYGTAPGSGSHGYYEQRTPIGSFAATNYANRGPLHQANNPYLGATSQGISGVGPVQANGMANPYLGATTRQATAATNPMAGMNNAYLQSAIDAAQQDVGRNWSRYTNPQFDRMAQQSGSFGNTGVEQYRADSMRDLGSTMGNLANNMRMQDYTLQANLGESAANRQTAVSQFNSQLNAADLARNMAGTFQGQGMDLQAGLANAGFGLDTQRFNATLGSSDLARNAGIASQMSLFNAGAGNAANQFYSSLDQQANLFNAGAANNMAEAYRNRQQQQGQFDASLGQRRNEFDANYDFNSWMANNNLMRTGQLDQLNAIDRILGWQGQGMTAANQQRQQPLDDWMRLLQGFGYAGGLGGTSAGNTSGSSTTTGTQNLYGNPYLAAIGAALAGYNMWGR